jgi:hypothetical protein
MISVDLKKLMEEALNLDNYSYRLAPVYIETVFRVLPEGHELRGSVAVLAMKYGILNGYYKTQEKMVDGFAVEIPNQIRKQDAISGDSSDLRDFFNMANHTF